jgi:DNA-binding NarL/FixJ family response regulator
MNVEGNRKETRILIADDQAKVRSALLLLLRHEPRIQVIGEAQNITQALALTRAKRPDLILLDWELTLQSDISAIAALRNIQPNLLVIALSGQPDARGAALQAGANAFVSKGDPPEQLLAALYSLNSA